MDWNSPIHRDCYPTAVKRYVLTYKAADGLRTLVGPQQGRYTHATREQAESFLARFIANNRPAIIERYGPIESLQVRACACWPEHFDPCGIYFDEHPDDTVEAVPPIPGGPQHG